MSSPLDGAVSHRDRDRDRPELGRLRDESGNILVMFALMLPLFLFCCAIVIDVGYWWANGKKAQIAADACALAAARELPENWNQDRVRVQRTVATTPISTTSCEPLAKGEGRRAAPLRLNSVISPYPAEEGGDPASVRRGEGDDRRSHVLRKDHREAGPHDHASRGGREPDRVRKMAIYVHSLDCDPGDSLEFDGKDMHISGWVHTEARAPDHRGAGRSHLSRTSRRTRARWPSIRRIIRAKRCQHPSSPRNQVADFVPGHPDYLPEGIAPIRLARLVHAVSVRLVSAAGHRDRDPEPLPVQGEQDRDRGRQHQGRRKPRHPAASGRRRASTARARSSPSTATTLQRHDHRSRRQEIKINPLRNGYRPSCLRRRTRRGPLLHHSQQQRLALRTGRYRRSAGDCPVHTHERASVQRRQQHLGGDRLQPVHPDSSIEPEQRPAAGRSSPA